MPHSSGERYHGDLSERQPEPSPVAFHCQDWEFLKNGGQGIGTGNRKTYSWPGKTHPILGMNVRTDDGSRPSLLLKVAVGLTTFRKHLSTWRRNSVTVVPAIPVVISVGGEREESRGTKGKGRKQHEVASEGLLCSLDKTNGSRQVFGRFH